MALLLKFKGYKGYKHKMTSGIPWQRQKELQKKYVDDEVPTIHELVNILANIRFGNLWPKRQTKQARALIAIYYLTAARASEILYTPYLRKRSVNLPTEGKIKDLVKVIDKKKRNKKGFPTVYYEYKILHEYKGISKQDIKFKEISGHKCMILRVENRKNKTRKTKNQPVPLDFENDIAWFISDYLKMIDFDSILFPFSRRRAEKIIEETIGWNIHFIRHIRATHLISLYDFNEQALIKYMGWTDGRPAKHYMELKTSDTLRQFYKNKDINQPNRQLNKSKFIEDLHNIPGLGMENIYPNHDNQ